MVHGWRGNSFGWYRSHIFMLPRFQHVDNNLYNFFRKVTLENIEEVAWYLWGTVGNIEVPASYFYQHCRNLGTVISLRGTIRGHVLNNIYWILSFTGIQNLNVWWRNGGASQKVVRERVIAATFLTHTWKTYKKCFIYTSHTLIWDKISRFPTRNEWLG
jgi:hypothetical protein